MAQLTHADYDALERALAKGSRVSMLRRGRPEYVIVPLAFSTRGGREIVEARNPTTGDSLMIYLDEVDAIEALS
jgi:hypothetical protein